MFTHTHTHSIRPCCPLLFFISSSAQLSLLTWIWGAYIRANTNYLSPCNCLFCHLISPKNKYIFCFCSSEKKLQIKPRLRDLQEQRWNHQILVFLFLFSAPQGLKVLSYLHVYCAILAFLFLPASLFLCVNLETKRNKERFPTLCCFFVTLTETVCFCSVTWSERLWNLFIGRWWQKQQQLLSLKSQQRGHMSAAGPSPGLCVCVCWMLSVCVGCLVCLTC